MKFIMKIYESIFIQDPKTHFKNIRRVLFKLLSINSTTIAPKKQQTIWTSESNRMTAFFVSNKKTNSQFKMEVKILTRLSSKQKLHIYQIENSLELYSYRGPSLTSEADPLLQLQRQDEWILRNSLFLLSSTSALKEARYFVIVGFAGKVGFLIYKE